VQLHLLIYWDLLSNKCISFFISNLIFSRKKTKVIDPSSLVPLNKTHVYIGLLLSWILVISAVCVYHVLHGKNLGKGAADEKIGQRPLLLNIPQDGSNPFFTGR